MDRIPGDEIVGPIVSAARATPGVRKIEALKVRKAGLGYLVELHVQADPALSLRHAHVLSGRVKQAILAARPEVQAVLIHMEPHEDEHMENAPNDAT
jgi:divalent metal cation (Fe/Co/Zn/Cd) transporter